MLSIGIRTDFINLPEVAGLGFDYAEMSLRALAALSEGEFSEFAEYVDGTGLNIAASSDMLPENLPITGPGVNATALHGYLSHAFGRARRLGVKVAALDAAAARDVPDNSDYPFAWRQLGNFLRLAQGHAREHGLTIALEPLRKTDCRLLNLVSEATLIAGLLQLDNIAVAAHSGHMAMASEPVSTLRQAAPLLRHVYLENALTRKLPCDGDGEDYARVLDMLADIGYTGGVTLSGIIGDGFTRDAGNALTYIKTLQRS